ncbi:MAG: hypothetical protein ACI4DT_06755 [Chordicoccus sp.]
MENITVDVNEKAQSKLYYYTDYQTFKLILEKGTMRFKESTESNDRKDTKRLYERVSTAINDYYKKNNKDAADIKFLKYYCDRGLFERNRVALVACFTSKADSRLLWDAYTMNRKDRRSDRYNGACLEFDTKKFANRMTIDIRGVDYKTVHPILYGDKEIDSRLDQLLLQFQKERRALQSDPNQYQNLIPPICIKISNHLEEFRLKKCLVLPFLKLINQIGKESPIFKSDFWSEEDETRAYLSLKRAALPLPDIAKSEGGNYYYYDLPIDEECISKVILGPEFSEDDRAECEKIRGKIAFSRLNKIESRGTGIITNH